MRLKLENVNNIQRADINLNGITVITGKTGTGKSTIARALHIMCRICGEYTSSIFYDDTQRFDLGSDKGHIVLIKDDGNFIEVQDTHIECEPHKTASNSDIELDGALLKLKDALPRGAFEQLIRIQHNGFLVIDEPETHLHPASQLEVAEAIIIMRKQFGLHVLLTTNSPYFLHAMEVYSAYHKIADQCFYYLADGIEFENVNGNIDKIYKEFLAPIQKLEVVEAEIDE